RYLRRMSSPAFSCAWNGSGSALFNTSMAVATTSTWPVRMFAFTLSRRRTMPVTRRQSSYPTCAAVATTAALPAASDGSATIWTMPSWSRRSMKHRPPRSRATSAQPHRVTVCPTRDSSIRPQKWVRMDYGAAGNSPSLYVGAAAAAIRVSRLPPLLRGVRRLRGDRLRVGRLRLGGRLGGVAGQVALAVLLEVGLVPAATGQAEAGRGNLALDRRGAAGGAGIGVRIGKLLQAVERVPAGVAGEGIDRHAAILGAAQAQSSRSRTDHLPGAVMSDRHSISTLAALLIALGVLGAGWFASRGLVAIKTQDRYVTVKGSAERIVDADLVVWP